MLKKIENIRRRLQMGVAEAKVKKQDVSVALLKAQSRAVIYKTYKAELDENIKVVYDHNSPHRTKRV